MCGVVGIVSAGRRVEVPRLQRALGVLRHRGPDGSGVFVAPDGRAGLGHVRLAVVDPEGGAQPLANEDRSVVAVVNGEIYDAAEMRRALAARGHRFRTRSDSELLLRLYEEHGDACVERARGELAFLLWDARRGRLLAARDRFGVKPLVFAEHDGDVLFASEAKALFAMGVPAAWDEASFLHAAQMQYTLPDRTLFRGVRQVEPGTRVVVERGRLRADRYWDLDYPREDPRPRETGVSRNIARSPEESPDAGLAPDLRPDGGAGLPSDVCARAGAGLASEMHPRVREVRAALDEAVRARLVADVPVCFQLSGGVDSSAVVALAAPHLPSPPACFTVQFDDPAYDEAPIAERTAAHIGAVLHRVDVPRARLLDALPAAVAHGEGLAINGHIAAKYLLSKAIHDAGFKVVLTGEGSDEIFAGYAHLRRDIALERDIDREVANRRAHTGEPDRRPGLDGGFDRSPGGARLHATNGASAGLMLPEGESLPLDGVRAALGFVPSWMEAKGTLGHRVGSLLAPDFLRSFEGTSAATTFLASVDVEGQLRGRARVDQSLYLWTKTALAGYILRTLGDGMEMAHAVEGRVPFLDHHLFGVARSLPTSFKIRDGSIEKWALREALRGVVPEEVRARRKHPFLAPPLSLAGTELVQDLLRADRFRAPFFDRAKLTAALDALPSMSDRERVAMDPALMLAASAGILHATYGL